MKTYIPYSLLAAAAACGMAFGAETAYTTPVGYVSQSITANSDSYVSVPLRIATSGAGALSAAPDLATIPGSAVVSLAGTPGFTPNAFANTHYARFRSGAADGTWYPISANTANSVTLSLNGATLTAAAADTVEVIKFWTLAELFDPALATNDPLTTPNAVVSSAGTSPGTRRTQILIPDLSGSGIDLSPLQTFYVNAGIWKQVGQGATSFNDFQVWPDTYFVIRQPVSVTSNTTYTISGEVDMDTFATILRTNDTTQQDNFVGLVRPVDVTLDQLGLGGTSAFVTSTATNPGGRRDQLLVYDTATVEFDKAPAKTYFYFGGEWRQVGVAGNAGSQIIPAGNGVIIRKFAAPGGPSAQWLNPPNY